MGGIDRFVINKRVDYVVSYLNRLPTFAEFPPEIELRELNGATLDFWLRQTGLPKMIRAAVVRAVGNVEYQRSNVPEKDLYHVTIGDIRNSSIEQLAGLQGSGLKSAQILKRLVG